MKKEWFSWFWMILLAILSTAVAYNLYSKESEDDELFGSSFYSTFFFLFFFAFGLGMNLWVTFIAGIVMFKTLPRHMFGNLQSRLFPCFFAASGVSFLAQLFSFSPVTSWNLLDCEEDCMVKAILAGFVCAFLNGWHVGPKSTVIMFKCHVFEKEEGETPPNIIKLKENDEYMKLRKQFGMYHGISMLLNLVCLAAHLYTLYFVVCDICVRFIQHCL